MVCLTRYLFYMETYFTTKTTRTNLLCHAIVFIFVIKSSFFGRNDMNKGENDIFTVFSVKDRNSYFFTLKKLFYKNRFLICYVLCPYMTQIFITVQYMDSLTASLVKFFSYTRKSKSSIYLFNYIFSSILVGNENNIICNWKSVRTSYELSMPFIDRKRQYIC